MEPTGVETQEVAAPVQTEEIQEPAQETVQTGVTTEVAAQESSEGESTQEVSNEEAGRLEAIKAERERRQAAEARNEILQKEVDGMRRMQQPPQGKDPLDGLEDDDIVSVKSIRDYNKKLEEKFNQQLNAQKVNISTMMARQRHEDFDEVIQQLPKVANQAQIGYILAADDPAETGYMFVKGSPQYIDSLTKETVQKTAKKTVETIQRHSSGVKTLSNSGSGAAKTKINFDTMPQEEFDRIVAANRFGDTTVLKKYGL